MPSPTVLLTDVGLAPKSELPTRIALKVLSHLGLPGKPRLFVQTTESGVLRSSVSNSEHAVGFPIRIDVRSLINGGYVKLDSELTKACVQSMSAYQISARGREALVQVAAHKAYEQLVRLVVPKIIEQLRLQYADTIEA